MGAVSGDGTVDPEERSYGPVVTAIERRVTVVNEEARGMPVNRPETSPGTGYNLIEVWSLLPIPGAGRWSMAS